MTHTAENDAARPWPSAHSPQPCGECGKVYKTLAGMLAHIKREHRVTPPGQSDTADIDAPEEVVYGAVARAMALAADDPDWMNVTRWPRVTPPVVTDA